MEVIRIRDGHIKLVQAIKLAGMVDTGADGNMLIIGGKVKVNGDVEYRRGRKLYEGDTVEYKGQSLTIKSP